MYQKLDNVAWEKYINEYSSVVLQAINFKTKEKRLVSSESKINLEIGNAKITIPVSETTLINSIIKELLEKC